MRDCTEEEIKSAIIQTFSENRDALINLITDSIELAKFNENKRNERLAYRQDLLQKERASRKYIFAMSLSAVISIIFGGISLTLGATVFGLSGWWLIFASIVPIAASVAIHQETSYLRYSIEASQHFQEDWQRHCEALSRQVRKPEFRATPNEYTTMTRKEKEALRTVLSSGNKIEMTKEPA